MGMPFQNLGQILLPGLFHFRGIGRQGHPLLNQGLARLKDARPSFDFNQTEIASTEGFTRLAPVDARSLINLSPSSALRGKGQLRMVAEMGNVEACLQSR